MPTGKYRYLAIGCSLGVVLTLTVVMLWSFGGSRSAPPRPVLLERRIAAASEPYPEELRRGDPQSVSVPESDTRHIKGSKVRQALDETRKELAKARAELEDAKRTVSTFSDVDKALSSLETATIVYNPPKKINIDESKVVKLGMSLKDDTVALARLIGGNEPISSAHVKVSPQMRATLTGSDFNIKDRANSTQVVGSGETTQWEWEITPKSPGTHTLNLSLTALVMLPDGMAQKSFQTFDKQIIVDVTLLQSAKQVFTANWQWAWGALLIPLVGWLWRRRKVIPPITTPPYRIADVRDQAIRKGRRQF